MKQIKALRLLPDRVYLQILYYYHFHKFINFKNPRSFNEKTQWLKLYDCKDIYTTMVDKYLAKDYVANIIGTEHIIPTIQAWDNVDDIDFDMLPQQFVLKCNHDSGGLVICKDKSSLDIEKAKRKIQSSFNNNGYWYGRERPYKDIKPKVFAEQYMEDSKTNELRDYKFFCFDGKVKALFVASDRQKKNESVKFDFFDQDYNHLPFTNGHPNAKRPPEKPETFDKMKEIAEKLSDGVPFMRVDLYEVDGRIYFGEITLYHGSGCLPFEPEEWGITFGNWLKLPKR